MQSRTSWLLVFPLAGLLLAGAGCSKLRARDQLNKGVRAFKSAQFNEAIEHFKTAVALDPSLVNAQLYLATAYQSQFIPGAPSEDNLRMGQQAVDEYKNILVNHPDNVNAVAGLASLYYGLSKFDLAKQYYQKQVDLEPSNPVPYYSIGSIDWTLTFQPRMAARAAVGISDQTQPFVSAKKPSKEALKACEDVRDKNLPLIEEGLKDLQKALDLRADYSDAMQYVNLLYRERADISCTDPQARAADLKTADDWADKALKARQEETLKAQQAPTTAK
ncbi:MAG: tetratricopeptide repeat protein [Terriglobales bacterium]